MSRLRPYIGVVAVFLVGVFFVAISSDVSVPLAPVVVTKSASSTLAVVETIVDTSTIAETDVLPSESPPIPKKAVPRPPLKATEGTAPSVVTSVPIPAPIALTPSGSAELDASASALRSALVNIICYAPAGSSLRSISGSGVIVDSKGIILTNAHIAQNFLLADRNVSCTIRAGSPAVDKYKASLIYIPSAWVNANAKILTESNPSGTGEYDFAFLAVSKSITRDELPSSFPSIPLATSPSNIGTPVVIASYGAQFLESSQIQSSLFPTIVFGSVKDVFTFATNTIDVLALGGSAAAQEGSSGGGVSNINSELVGTITTSTTKGTTDTRKLDAITASYIRAEYASETGSALDLLLAEPTATAISDFAPQMPALEAILTANL